MEGGIVREFKNVIGVSLLVVLVGTGVAVVRSQERAAREWRYYGADHAFTRYAPLDQINRDNVKNVKIAWRRPAVNTTLTGAFPELKVTPYLKSTPIVINGVVCTQDAHGLVTAFDGATGKTIKATGKVLWEIELPSGTTGGPMTYMSGDKQYIVVTVGGKDHPAELVALALSDAT